MTDRQKLKAHRQKMYAHAKRSKRGRVPTANESHPVVKLAAWMQPHRDQWPWYRSGEVDLVENIFTYECALKLARWMVDQPWWADSILRDSDNKPVFGPAIGTAWADFFSMMVSHYHAKLVNSRRFAEGVFYLAQTAMLAETKKLSRMDALLRLGQMVGCPTEDLARFLHGITAGPAATPMVDPPLNMTAEENVDMIMGMDPAREVPSVQVEED